LFPDRVWAANAQKESDAWRSDRIIIPRRKPNPVSPSVLATGVDATVTGVHMNEWLLDDILSKNAAEAAHKGNFSEIESTNRWITQLQPLLKSPKRDRITVVGTRWWKGDSYEYIPDFFGRGAPVEEFLWTLTLPDGEVQQILLKKQGEVATFCRPARDAAGHSLFPERYDDDDLQKMQQEDPVFFAGQYLLDPTAGGASEFDAKWLKYYEWDGTQIRYRDQSGSLKYATTRDMVCLVSVDPAISDAATAARSAVPVVGLNSDGQFLLEDYAERGLGMFDLAHRVVEAYVKYQPRRIFIETIVYQRALLEALSQVARDRNVPDLIACVQEIKSHAGKSKDFRIYGLEPFFKRGTFYINRSHKNFIDEFTSFPLGHLRDTLDALSFQKDEWEKTSKVLDGGSNSMADRIKRGHQAAIDRIKAAWG
jgi:phage terminase large subunit-like protein